ncbi:MAG TPA: hypothetical protein PLI75_16350 [Anaerolineales bacterium]|nr:hypothetical protein [Anaerolineales bacterium]
MKNKTLFLISILALLTLVISACASIAPATQAAEVQPAQPTVTVEAVNLSQAQPSAAPLESNMQSLQPAPDAGTQPLNAQPQGNQPMQNGQGGQPNQNNDCRPDLTTAATTLGITAEELQAALGNPAQGKPDLAAAAATLGVTEDALKQAIQQAMPANCNTMGGGAGNGQQPPQEAYDACIGLSEGAACTVLTPNGSLSGTCTLPPVNASTQLACAPINGPQQQP